MFTISSYKTMFKKPILVTCLLVSILLSSNIVFAYNSEKGRVWSEREYTQRGNVRSRSEVIREVKERYNAEILRIEYKERKKAYKVRVLMPNGKVRNLTISARG